jgi:hypothetical protein
MSQIQTIFRDHSAAYLGRFGATMSDVQRQALRAIAECRSGACGHHLFVCPDCGEQHVANSSCGNRHCPLCQNEKAAEWVYRRELDLLPCTYFLATFTLPEALRALTWKHPAEVYGALLDEAAASLRTLEADPRFVGCQVAGFFAVLHTWGRQLQYHPHAHFVVPGGGLSEDRTQWVAARGDFLVHVRALSRLFRGKLKARLDNLGLLAEVPPEVWKQEWVVHCEAVGDGRAVMKYLGAYVFRVAISEARIETYDGSQVTFKYQKVGSAKWKRLTLSALEFIRRFLQHVLPKGFVKVRHFGFLAPNFAVPLQRIREMICLLYEMWRAQPVQATPPRKPKPLRCGRCAALLVWVKFLAPPRPAAVT